MSPQRDATTSYSPSPTLADVQSGSLRGSAGATADERGNRYGSELDVLNRSWQREQLRRFLRKFCAGAVRDVITAGGLGRHYGVTVRALDLIEFNNVLACLIFQNPKEFLPVFDGALRDVQISAIERSDLGPLESINTSVGGDYGAGITLLDEEEKEEGVGHLKENAHIRLTALPPGSDHHKRSVSEIRSADTSRLILVEGTVVRASKARMLEMKRTYKCLSCGACQEVDCDMAKGNTIPAPVKCADRDCKYPSYEEVESCRDLHDYQEVKIQERAQGLGVGSIPRSISIVLLDDLVDSCKPGDVVEVTGTVLRRWQPVSTEVKIVIDMAILANSVFTSTDLQAERLSISDEMREGFKRIWRDHNSRPLAVRNLIVASICPQIYGLFSVKLAILMCLIGGAPTGHGGSSSLKKRDVSHLLLLGDPGCGKSQFLRFAAKLSPRTVMTTGIGTTGAGLTCSTVKDESGEWGLEAGALVLADRGLCIIDEFGSMRKEELTAIHEAMEQQTLTVTKAGINRTLNARTTVFAVANPKGSYDLDLDVTENTDIQSPLLSRFDLILLILDTKNPQWDEVISTFVLQAAMAKGQAVAENERGADSQGGEQQQQQHADHFRGLTPISNQPWPASKVQKYIAWVKEQHPTVSLSDGAKLVLESYYQAQRQSDRRSASRTTVRLLESLIRLTQSHARLMCRSVAEVQDALVSVICMETSVAAVSLLSLQSALHSDFPEDPDHEFEILETMLLDRLGLSHLASPSLGPRVV